MMKTKLLLILMLLCTAMMANITQFYSFSSISNETYTDIAGTPIVWTGTGDDELTPLINIGFTLTYGDSTYTQVKICTNGYITLGNGPGQTNLNDLESTTMCPVIAGLWDDLQSGRLAGTTNPVTSAVSYLAAGATGHRSFTVQFKNVYWDFLTEPRNSYVDFQIVLKEDNSIAIKFGPNSATNPRPQAGASIGMNMKPGGAGYFFSVTPGTPSTVSTTAENDTIRVHVPNGTSYYFNTAVQNDIAAVSLTGPNNPSQGIVNDYTIRVKNLGSLPQNNYSVKLANTTVDLVSVIGDSLGVGDSLDVVMHWIPATAGVVVLHGRIVLDGDQNPQNDQTATMTVVVQNVIGTVAGSVKNQANQNINGATVTAGTYTATTGANGMYVLHLPMDSYDITASAPGYAPSTQAGVFVIAGQTLPLNFILGPVANDDNLLVTSTSLLGNYPNPFKANTSLDYTVKEAATVKIEIYNLKGQLIRTLVNEMKTNGNFSATWDGKDTSGKHVSAGIYYCKMSAGDYQATRRMLLLK